MTTVGKLLVFLNLVLGVGAATWATAVYSQRPAWFDPPADAAAKGGGPLTFKGLSAEIDTLGKAAASAGAAWNAQYARLTKAEDVRAVRQQKMFGGGGAKGLIEVARVGGYPKAGPAAFFNLKEDPATKLLDLDPNPAEKGVVVLGPDGQPLRGADTLLERFNADAKAANDLAGQSAELRKEQAKLGLVVAADEARLLKQLEIRENLRNEAAFLAGLEVNGAAELDTVVARRGQLERALSPFRRR
ncbi:MAG: hypothetical protein K2X82_12390 [Gemmataceae bacterium]|nr:hypothetical protein [Gemmataceae bacterium]